MDNPQKKRSIFGSFSFWGRSPTVPTDPDQRAEFYRTTDLSHTPPIPRVGFNASPESPAKRASATQLSSRKMIEKPQGPSSKLSQSMTVSDFVRPPSSHRPTNFSASTAAAGTPRPITTRMPGDNPNKPSNPGSFTISTRRSSNIPASASTPRNLFRSSGLNSRPAFAFSPRVPPTTMNQSFPPTTPGRPPRGSTAEVNGRMLSNVNTASLFSMRIPSPPHDLTGERLAKEVPENHNRAGSIYADEFLTDYCPPDFDDLQRRQFYCILDLRRLKYAADEVFVRKDWKINILNFAKEYEKSRSLIMLRYGLYEFKTVKASEAIKKQWQKEHGIPSSDDEKDENLTAYQPSGTQGILSRATGKRKAEDDLPSSNDSPSKNSTSLNNKRRATEREPLPEAASFPSPGKVKRKAALDDSDEKQPNKLHKSTASPQQTSAVKSLFESIANGATKDKPPAAAAATATPSKRFRPSGDSEQPAGSGLFSGPSKPPNGNQVQSVLAQGGQPPATNNIFGHLSDASKGSGDNDADGESEISTSSGAESEGDDKSETRDAGQNDEPSAATSSNTTIGTSMFGMARSNASKKPLDNAPPSASETAETAKGRSLFDRLTYGNDGQPVRMLPAQAQESKELPDPTPPLLNGQQSMDSTKGPSAAPTNNTWNTDTPIKFTPSSAEPGSSLFSSMGQKPTALFAKEPAFPAPSSSLSGPSAAAPSAKPAEEPAALPQEAPKPVAPQPLFGKAPTPPSKNGIDAFGSAAQAQAPSAATPKPFSSTTPSFGQQKPVGEKGIASSGPATPSLFAATPKPFERESPKSTPLPQPSALFGNFGNATKNEEPKPSPQPPVTSLFGAPSTKAAEPSIPASQSASSLFGTATSKPANSNMFASSSAFSTSTSGSSQPPPKPIFAPSSSPPLFGTNGTKPAPSGQTGTGSLFGGASAAPASKPSFGAAAPISQAEPAKSQSSIFANPSATATAAPSGNTFSFGGSQSTPQLGASSQQSATQPNSGQSFGGASSSFTFTAGGAEQPSFSNPFATSGTTSAPPSFNFGSNSSNENGTQSSAPFVFGGGGATATPSITFGGASGSNTPTTESNNLSGAASFTFGAGSSQTGGPSIFAQSKPPGSAGTIFGNLAPPAGGTSTGTSTSERFSFLPPPFFSSFPALSVLGLIR